jgi:hypothetical protein
MIKTPMKMVLKDHLSTRIPNESLEAPLTKPPPMEAAHVISASLTYGPLSEVEP